MNAPPASYISVLSPPNSLCDIMSSYCDVPLHHDVILWHYTIGHYGFTWEFPSVKSMEITFFDLVTLAFDLQSQLGQGQLLYQNQGHRSNGLAVRVFTHRQTHGKTAPIVWPRLPTREVNINTVYLTGVCNIKIHVNITTRSTSKCNAN